MAAAVIAGRQISPAEAVKLINTPDQEVFELLAAANGIRAAFKGNKVRLCAIVNAKSGRCSENCSFCAQSAHFKTEAQTYPLLSTSDIVGAAKTAAKFAQATCFSIVTSGKGVAQERELATIGAAVATIHHDTDLNRCVSLGILTLEQIKQLKGQGLNRLHHNLETAASFFANICTTHSYQERLQTIRYAKEAGLQVCSGGIFGLGETPEQRVELGLTLRELQVESIPINILNPITGTPAAENYRPIPPLAVLKLIATYRFLLPKADIGVFGGRERALRQLQPLMFLAGANSLLIGNYLTTAGRSPEDDLRMISDLGLEIDR